MDAAAAGALINLGVSGIGLYLFATGKLLAKAVVDELLAKIVALYEKALVERDKRIRELTADRDSWKALALGTEQRLDRVTHDVLPTVAGAVGLPVPSGSPSEA